MDNVVIAVWFLALFWPSCAAPVSEILTVSVRSPVSVQRGHVATLPCWLTSSQSAEDMEVSWYQGDDQKETPEEYDTPVLRYKAKNYDYTSQKASYAGRVSFGLKEGTSGGLKTGDVSLKLQNVTLEDTGNYNCFVSSLADYDRASVSLIVTETGLPPLLSAERKDDDKVNVSCESEGWHPKPELRWSDRTEALTSADVSFSKDSAGLYTVRSWLLVPSLSEVSCAVGLPSDVPKEARIHLKYFPSSQEESGSSSAGWVAFGILLAAVVAVSGALYFLYFRRKGAQLTNSPDEIEPLLSEATWSPPALSDASKHYVNVKLVDTGNQWVKIRGFNLRDSSDVKPPDGDRVTSLTAVRGSPGFTSGQHYWEVSLAKTNVESKKSWWIGVTDKQEIPDDKSLSPTINNGFWFLSSCPNQEHTVQVNTDPEVYFPLESRPKTVGVHLDYDNGKLSFYNVEGKCLIGSLAAKFTGELFPVFNPGKGDISSMEVLQRAQEGQSNNIITEGQILNAEQDQTVKTEKSVVESSK